MLVHDPDVQQLVAVLKDHNTWGNDEEVGRLSLPIRQLPVGEAQDLHLELGPSKGTNLSKMSRNPLRAGVQVHHVPQSSTLFLLSPALSIVSLPLPHSLLLLLCPSHAPLHPPRPS